MPDFDEVARAIGRIEGQMGTIVEAQEELRRNLHEVVTEKQCDARSGGIAQGLEEVKKALKENGKPSGLKMSEKVAMGLVGVALVALQIINHLVGK